MRYWGVKIDKNETNDGFLLFLWGDNKRGYMLPETELEVANKLD